MPPKAATSQGYQPPSPSRVAKTRRLTPGFLSTASVLPAAPAASFQPAEWGQVDSQGRRCYPLHAGQSDILRSHARFKAAIAGTGGGKTALGPLWVMLEIRRAMEEQQALMDRQPHLVLEPILGMVVAPTYQIMARATAPTLVRMLEGTDLEGRYVESKNRYWLPHDLGVIWLLSADNAGSLEGGQFDFAWIDEGGQLNLDAWVAVQGRVGKKQAPVLITTTPYTQNWLYHHFFRRWQAGDPDYYVRQWQSEVNPSYPKAEADRARSTMSKQRAAMRYDGQFVQMAGLVYPDFANTKISTPALPWSGGGIPAGRLVGGIDFGWNSPLAAVAGTAFIADEDIAAQLHCDQGDEVLYIYYERYKRFTSMAEHSAALPSHHYWWADPARPDCITELRRSGHTVRPATNDILIGVDAVSARIYTHRLFIHEACTALFAESQEYTYPGDEDEVAFGEKPVKEFDHALDALRYLITGLDRRQLAMRKKRTTAGVDRDARVDQHGMSINPPRDAAPRELLAVGGGGGG